MISWAGCLHVRPARVRRPWEIEANPEISNEDIRTKAVKLDDAVARMSARQFNATYPLQVKRRMRPRKRSGRKAAKGAKRGRKAGAAKASGRKVGRPSKSGAKRGRPSKAASSGGRGDAAVRDRVRGVLVSFARDLASSDGAGLVDVIAGVDGYVDRVMKAAGSR